MTKVLVTKLKADGYGFGTIEQRVRLTKNPDDG